jgi:hypothetical protein
VEVRDFYLRTRVDPVVEPLVGGDHRLFEPRRELAAITSRPVCPQQSSGGSRVKVSKALLDGAR